MESKKGFFWAGVVAAFTALTCCISPLVLVMLGFGTAFSMAVMHNFHAASIISGIILMILTSLYLVKKKEGICNSRSLQKNWKPLLAVFAVAILSWLSLNYIIVEPAAKLVYGKLPVHQKEFGNLPEMAAAHNFQIDNLEVIPENQGMKLISLKIGGIFCGSCGPAIEYDIKSIKGVIDTKQYNEVLQVRYDSSITSKDFIMANVHYPYEAKLLKEDVLYG